jgi:hypothetical protein
MMCVTAGSRTLPICHPKAGDPLSVIEIQGYGGLLKRMPPPAAGFSCLRDKHKSLAKSMG